MDNPPFNLDACFAPRVKCPERVKRGKRAERTFAARRALGRVFNVTPQSWTVSAVKKARTFIWAALDQPEKVTPKVKRLLKRVGAWPLVDPNPYAVCFGLRYSETSLVCLTCQLSPSCKHTTADVGVSDFRIVKTLPRNPGLYGPPTLQPRRLPE